MIATGRDRSLGSHRFLYSDGTFTSTDIPAAISVDPDGIDDAGTIGGACVNVVGKTPAEHGFVVEHGAVHRFQLPCAPQTSIFGLTGQGHFFGLPAGGDCGTLDSRLASPTDC